MTTIIGVCGFIGSGKDTVADYLVNQYRFRRDSFANSLKDAVSAVFGWDRELLEGRTTAARDWREQPDIWWSYKLGMPITPRWVLQQWGTEVCRKAFHNDIWIISLENRLRQSTDNIVISDCRFPNEVLAIKNAGGKVIWVKRGALPDWYDMALAANQSDIQAQAYLSEHNIHASETAWVGTKFDAEIDNNGTLAELYVQVDKLL
jgi:hypothetical protein